MTRRHWISRAGVGVGTVVTLVMCGALAIAEAGGEKTRTVPVDAIVHGNTYGEWSARWWQWVLSIPAPVNPNLDPTGANCGQGQAGPVWFLAGGFGGGGDPINRTCTIPAGKAVFMPLINVVFGSGAFDCDPTVPGVPCNLAALRQAAAGASDMVHLEVILNGRSLKRPLDQRVQSPAFAITYPQNAVFGVPVGTYAPNVSDGYWLMLDQLSQGMHTIVIKGAILSGPFAGTIIDTTYTVTVVP